MKKVYKSLMLLLASVLFSLVLGAYINKKNYSGLQGIMRGLSYNHQMAGILSALIILIIGILFMLVISVSLSTEMLCLLAFPVGCVIWIVAGCLILYIGVPYDVWTICAIVLLILLVAFFVSRFNHKKNLELDAVSLLCGVIIYVAVIIFASNGLLYTFNNGDSHYFIELLGAVIINERGLITSFVPLLSETSLGMAVLAGLPYMLGSDNLFVLHHTLMISFIGLFAYAVYHKNEHRKAMKTVLLLAVLLSTPSFLLLSGWIITNTYVMIILFILAVLTDYCDGNSMEFKLLLFLFSLGLAFVRVESPLLIACISVAFFATNKKKSTILICTLVPGLLGVLMGYYRLIVLQSGEIAGHYLNLTTILLMMGLFGIIAFYYLFIRDRWKFIIRRPLLSIDVVSVIVVLCLSVYLKQTSFDVFKTYLYNFTDTSINGFWGISAGFLAILWIWTRYNYNGQFSYAHQLTVIYLWMVVILGLCRACIGQPPRIGFGDSLNRSFISAIPLVLYSITDMNSKSHKNQSL